MMETTFPQPQCLVKVLLADISIAHKVPVLPQEKVEMLTAATMLSMRQVRSVEAIVHVLPDKRLMHLVQRSIACMRTGD